MTVEDISPVGRGESASANPRLLMTLGTIGMIGAPMMSVDALYHLITHTPGYQNDPVIGTLGIFYIIGWMCTAYGMRRLRVTGNGPASAVIFTIQIIGLCLALVFTVLEATQLSPPQNSLFFQITDAAWPLSHLLLLVVGGMVIKAKIWRGWQAAAAFVAPAALVIFLIGSALGQRDTLIWTFPVFTTVGFLLLGNAVRTSAERSK